MSDPSPAPTETPDSAISAEIGRAVGSIWERRAGNRPKLINTEVGGDVVRCVIEEGAAEDGVDANGAVGDTNAYRTEATAAVARITKRSVSAFIAKRDAKSGTATQTFILDRLRVRH